LAEPPTAWLEAVRRVLAVVRTSDVTSLELANGEFQIRVRREPGSVAAPSVPADEPDVDEQHLHAVLAPFTGVFYRSPTPSGKSYVNVGDWVEADAVIGLIETMKIFNEVVAERSGRIRAFRADSGQLVHAGDVLVQIEPGERTAAAPESHL
jgi:acetyl-CoA carboxylase biotin carboxyl carrier protein